MSGEGKKRELKYSWLFLINLAFIIIFNIVIQLIDHGLSLEVIYFFTNGYHLIAILLIASVLAYIPMMFPGKK